MINTMVNVYASIFRWESHGAYVVFHVQVFSDSIQAVETVKHVGTTVEAFFGYTLIAMHLRECQEFGVSVET